MKTKENIAKELNISRKSLYNYMNELNIKELNAETISQLKKYLEHKNKSKEISKTELLEQLEKLKKENIELSSKNSKLEEEQTVLLNQIEWFRNSIDCDIRQLKESVTLLLQPPKKEKKTLFDKIFKR